MKHTVILAHPNRQSLCASIADVYVAAARRQGHHVLLRDLYAMDFDPRLKLDEAPTDKGYKMGADVLAERAALADTDLFVLIYPFWFNAPPAILKGYVDRVFSMGFGYDPDFGGTTPRLEGRQLLTISTSGAPDDWVRESGAVSKLMAQFDMHLAAVTGLTIADHIHFGGIAGALAQDDIDDIFAKVRADVVRLFPRRQPARATP